MRQAKKIDLLVKADLSWLTTKDIVFLDVIICQR